MELLNPKTAGENGQPIYDIQLHNCGFFKNLKAPVPTCRPEGRQDYHIIFVIEGSVNVRLKEHIQTANSGSIIFLPPNISHNYIYKEGESTDYCWLHFSGKIIESILKIFPFKDAIYPVANITEFKILIQNIYKINLKRKIGGEFLINAALEELIIKLGQSVFTEAPASPLTKKLTAVIQEIDTCPEADTDNRTLAEKCGVSEFHFIRIFKEKTGLTPVQYQISARINKAKLLLADTDMTLSEIAFMCGFSDPLYFSRLFKNKNGIPPKEFRKLSRK